jgi:hypothetical protein
VCGDRSEARHGDHTDLALLLALVPACYDSGSYDALLEYGPPTAGDSDGADSGDSSPLISTVTTEPPPHGSDSDSDASSAGDTGDDDTEGALPAPQIIEHEFLQHHKRAGAERAGCPRAIERPPRTRTDAALPDHVIETVRSAMTAGTGSISRAALVHGCRSVGRGSPASYRPW